MRRILLSPLLSALLVAAAAACGDPNQFVVHPPFDGDGGPSPGGPGGGPFCQKPDAGEPSNDPVVESSRLPPPISGGTLLIAADGHTAIAADPERDRVWAVDITTRTLVADISLQAGDEPGRLAQDSAGRVHVALRRGGAVATLDLAGQTVLARRPVCGAPRGIFYDAANDQLQVACADGQLVTLPASPNMAPSRRITLDPDLRDVVADGDKLIISRFRSAELLVVDGNGAITKRVKPPTQMLQGNTFEPAVAWRTAPIPAGGSVVVHQSDFAGVIETHCDGYGATANRPGIVASSLTFVTGPNQTASVGACLPSNTVLPVDVAISHDGTRAAVVSAGDKTVVVVPTTSTATTNGTGACQSPGNWTWLATGQYEPTAVAFDSANRVVIQTRQPALYVNGALLMELPGDRIDHTGHALFHRDSGKGLACASCHPEATQDGRTWTFANVGPRRTQFISGGILATAPFHWDGDLSNLNALMGEVFVNRMGGQPQSDAQIAALGRWLDGQPIPNAGPPPDLDAIARGQALFTSPDVGCTTCHNGAKHTNNLNADVGTGGTFQVPHLMGLASRAPFIHTGCAATLRDRFNPACGGGDRHGHTSQLTPAQIDDLVAYLQTL